ncbi:MAG: cobyric acid synthase, partial [Roseburia sp.]|nr:cobyric acid synthase [Roseburia sp.]
ILEPGIRMLEEKGGIPVTGVVPYMQITLEDEDSLTTRFEHRKEALIDIAVIRFPRISNFTDFMVFEQYEGVSLRYIDRAEELHEPDFIILPGSKNTMGDLKWMRQNGLEAAVKKRAGKVPVFGICGGYQMLGEKISDPNGVEEGGSLRGMELLPIETELAEEKIRTRVQGRIGKIDGDFCVLSGSVINGYEIHMGRSKKTGETADFCRIGTMGETVSLSGQKSDGTFCNNVYGTYVHGIFDEGDIAFQMVKALGAKKEISMEHLSGMDYQAFKEKEYDKLADTLRQYLDMDAVYRIMEEW